MSYHKQEYRLVCSPSSEVLQEVYQLRARVWKLRTEHFPANLTEWSDNFDATSMHFVVCAKDRSPVAAARLTVTDAVEEGPDFDVYRLIAKPLGFISRLVVSPAHRRIGLAQLLDEARLRRAQTLGCKTILANTRAGESRVRQLECHGFERHYIAKFQVTGPLSNVGTPTVLSLVF